MAKPYYEWMDLDSANVVGFYDSKEAVLRIIRHAYGRYGLAGLKGLALSRKGDEDEGTLLGEGEVLQRLALGDGPSTDRG